MEAESIQSTEAYIKILAWFHANRKPVLIGTGVVAVIGLVVGLMAWQKNQAETAADEQLMGVPLASIQDGRMVPAPANAFLDVAQKHPDTSAGEYGALLGAERLFLDGKYPEAHQEFSKFIDEHPNSSLLSQAKVGVAASLEGEGKINEAAQKYQEIIASYPTEQNIVSPVKLTLARLDEQLNKLPQALQYYEDLARIQNPYDPWSAEARERGGILLMKHPELQKQAQPAPGAMPTPLQSQKVPAPAPGKP